MECDCIERCGTVVCSLKEFDRLSVFFENQVKNGIFKEVFNDKFYNIYRYYSRFGIDVRWYKCRCCGTLWEFIYPDFEKTNGHIRKFKDGIYNEYEGERFEYEKGTMER